VHCVTCTSVQVFLFALVVLFVTALPKTPGGLVLAVWRSWMNLLDPGQAPETTSAASHVAVLGFLFFVLVAPDFHTATRYRCSRSCF
jgi:hypothetical protein